MAEPKHHTLIKHFEGCRLTAYLCPAGIPTIGWGHTGKDVTLAHVGLKVTITQAEADALFVADVRKFERGVDRLVTNLSLLPHQWGALVSFAFNVGLDEDGDGKAEGLGDSTLLKLVNKGDMIAAAKEFPKWVHAGGKVSEGLQRRRAAERFYFETGKLHFMLPGRVS